MEFIKYWWGNIKEGYRIFGKKIGIIGYVLDIVIAIVISTIVGDGFCERVIVLLAATLIVFGVFGLFYSLFFQPFNKYKNLQLEIEKYPPNILNITVDSSPFEGYLEKQGIYLFVISHEEKKILELRAKKILLCQRDSSTGDDSRGNDFGSGIPNFHFSWSNECDFTELLPGAQEELEVVSTYDSQETYPEFGLPHSKPPNTDEASIYDIEIRFIGKLEGETRYSLYDYHGEILYIPDSFYPTFEFIERIEDVPEELQSKVYTLSKENKNYLA